MAPGATRSSPAAGISTAVTICRMQNLHCNENVRVRLPIGGQLRQPEGTRIQLTRKMLFDSA
jgi:hypothetical protein